MSAQPFGAPLFRAFDSNGAPLAGGLLYTYAGGTSTPQATYTDQSGTVANANPMVLDSTGTAQVWLAPGVLYKFVLQNSSGVQQWAVDNYPSPAATATGSVQVAVNDPGGRLTYSPTQPVPSADQISQSTLYYLPYKSDQVPLYNGSSWSLYSIGTGLSQALTDTLKSPAAVVNNANYDVFVWLDGSTVRLSRGPAWASDTSRGTGAGTTQITQVNGRWVNAQSITNGPLANLGLYVGTIRTNIAALGSDSAALRYCWNNYNRKARTMQVLTASNWLYTGTSLRQANGNASNQLDYVVGLAEDEVVAEAISTIAPGGNSGGGQTAIGVDSTTVSSGIASGGNGISGTVPTVTVATASYRGIPGIGRHYLAWLEATSAGLSIQFGAYAGNAGILGDMLG